MAFLHELSLTAYCFSARLSLMPVYLSNICLSWKANIE